MKNEKIKTSGKDIIIFSLITIQFILIACMMRFNYLGFHQDTDEMDRRGKADAVHDFRLDCLETGDPEKCKDADELRKAYGL